MNQHNPWFNEECLGFLDQKKLAKMQWVQDPSQNNVDNLNCVRTKDSKHFRNKKMEYLKAKIEDLETNGILQYIRGLYKDISDFKKGYQPRTNIVKEETGNLVTDSHSILGRWRNNLNY